MSSPLLLLAAEAVNQAGDAAAPNGITQIAQDFGIKLPNLLAQVVNFGVLAFFLWYFGIRKVLATLDERQKKIESGLKYADDMKAKLEAVQQENAAILKKASIEAGRIIDEARKLAKDVLDKQTQEASGIANEMLTKAQQSIELEHKKMLAEARGEIARLVVVTTERVLAQRLSEADRAGYNEAAARELAQV